MFEATFDGTDREAAAALLAKGPKVLQILVNRMNVLGAKLQAHIVADKLQGQVLKHRSGKLSASIRLIPASVQSTTLFAEVLGGGGPAWYGAIHEYGGDRAYTIVPTNRKALRFVIGGRVIFAKRVLHPPLPMRSFMRSSLDDQRESIAIGLQQAMNEGAQGNV